MSTRTRYEVRLKASAEKELDGLPRTVFPHVVKAVLALETKPRRHGCVKLRGSDAYRCRVGNYRILYLINDAARIVEVLAVAHRKDAYR